MEQNKRDLTILLIGLCFGCLTIIISIFVSDYFNSQMYLGEYQSVNGKIIIYTNNPNFNDVVAYQTFNHELVHYKIDKGLIVIDNKTCQEYKMDLYARYGVNDLLDYENCNEVYAYTLENVK